MKKPGASAIEQYVIDKVREVRKAKNLTQRDLAVDAELSNSFIANVESPNSRAKYNLNNINAIAKAFKCSPRDLLPENAL